MAYSMKLYYKNLEAGNCPNCGGKRDTEWLHSSRCLRMSRIRCNKIKKSTKNKYQRRYHAKNRRAGVCAYCGRRLEPGFVRCKVCRERDKVRRALKVIRNRGVVITK